MNGNCVQLSLFEFTDTKLIQKKSVNMHFGISKYLNSNTDICVQL